MSPASEPNPIPISERETFRQWMVHVLSDTALASVIFGTPDILVHALRELGYSRFERRDILLLTILVPIFLGVCLVWIWKKRIAFRSRLSRIVLPVFGIWFFGPLMLMISATVGGGGFAKPEVWKSMPLQILLFPVFTFLGSTYDESLGAVLLATFCLPLLGLIIRPDPPTPQPLERYS